MSGFVSLELQIISINIISLFNGIWSWIKWDQRLEKISSLSVSDKLLDVKDIDWLKTVLLWIEVIRLIINRVSLLAYVINIYTITTRKWQNLLIFWMVLSLLKDIVLEVVVVIITFLQWYKGSITTLLLVWFIMEKTVWLIISTLKWFTILKWYMQLRKEAKIRRFTRIARRSIASIVNIPGRIAHSLNDECLDIATIRRDKYVSLLNLNKLSEKSSNKVNFNLRISKSLTTLITNDDSHDLNNTDDSSVHDLSVTEKSMKMLGLTAEDIMDAYARIQERSYWSEQDVTMKTPEAMEKVVAQFSLEKGGEGMNASRSEQKDNVEKAVDCNLMKEVMQHSQREKEEEDNKTISIDKKEQILIDKQQDVSLTKSEDVTFDKVDSPVKLTEFQKLQEDVLLREKRRKKEEEKLARIKHCPLSSAQCKNARDMEIKPCASLVKKLEAKLHPVSTNQKEKWFDQLDRRKYRAKLTPTGSDANKKECYKNSRTSLCACRRASKKNTDASKNGKYTRSTDVNDKNVKHDIDRKELTHFVSIVNAQKDKINNSALKYSEAYRLKKQIQKSEESSKSTIAWGSMSLAQTARPSGYTKNVATTNKSPRICQRNVQIEACNESSDFLNARSKWKVRNKQSTDPRSIHNTSFTEKNYARSENREVKASESRNDLTLLINKREIKAKKRHDLSPNRKLLSKEREAIELRALRTFNELTLLEDKKKLEANKNHNLSLDCKPTKESEVSEAKVFKSYNDFTLLKEQKKINTINKHNPSSNYKQLIGESSALKVFNEYTLSEDKKKLKTEGKHKSSKYEISKRYEENVETSTSVSSHLPEINHEETRILSETHRNANSNSELNERHAGQTYMSLNLREITRNIEWTAHPRGIILTNKNLHRQCLENGSIRESQQRDIVDDNVVSTLHNAFFFKPEIVTRIFRRAQTRIGESLSNFSTFWREDFNTEFVCQVNNETIAQWNRDSSASFDFNLERIVGNRNNFGNSSFPDANNNHVTREGNHDLCIIFIDQEQASQDSETAIIENSRTTVGESQDNARLSVENIESIFLMCILRELGVEMSEESIRDVTSSAEQIEEYEDISNVIVNNVDFQSSNFNTNDTSLEERNINRNENTILLQQQILHLNDNCSEDVDVTSLSVNIQPHDNLPDKKYMSTIDISSEKEIHKNNSSIKNDSNAASSLYNNSNNNQFDTVVHKSDKVIFNCIPKNTSQLSFPGSSSFVKESSHIILKSCDQEELQRLTQLADSEVTLANQEEELVMNLETTNYDKVSQSENVETLNILETTTQNDARNKDEDREVEKANISSHQFSTINQNDRLQQDDSFYSMYEKNNSTETPVSLGDGSVMEEFSNSTISPETSLNASTKNSEHSQ